MIDASKNFVIKEKEYEIRIEPLPIYGDYIDFRMSIVFYKDIRIIKVEKFTPKKLMNIVEKYVKKYLIKKYLRRSKE
jgi:hypothetical protein